MVREALGPELADVLVPLVEGGVQLHKIYGLMHDTCSTANRVAASMAELREEQPGYTMVTRRGKAQLHVRRQCTTSCAATTRGIYLLTVSTVCTMNIWSKSLVRQCEQPVLQRVGVCGWSVLVCPSCVRFAV
jgi:hypothetical protein